MPLSPEQIDAAQAIADAQIAAAQAAADAQIIAAQSAANAQVIAADTAADAQVSASATAAFAHADPTQAAAAQVVANALAAAAQISASAAAAAALIAADAQAATTLIAADAQAAAANIPTDIQAAADAQVTAIQASASAQATAYQAAASAQATTIQATATATDTALQVANTSGAPDTELIAIQVIYAAQSGSYQIVCYALGTLIKTVQGYIAIEDLKIGTLLPTLSGQIVPIVWIGKQQLMGYFLSQNQSPVCIHTGALGEGLPKRDLYVTAGHSVKINDYLVDAHLLVNGVTITQSKQTGLLEYYHIDLGEHHCILAEGVWSESYLECHANRETFVNAEDFYKIYPDHLTKSSLEKCLPHVADYRHPKHLGLFHTLLAYIPVDRITTDPDLHLVADGKRLDPYEYVPQAFMFRVPAGTQVLRLKSRTSRPCDLGLLADDRQLGFCIQNLTAQSQDGTVKIVLEPHHEKLIEGFHRAEGTQHRWTCGDALLPKMLLGDGTEDMTLTIKGSALLRYHLGEVPPHVRTLSSP